MTHGDTPRWRKSTRCGSACCIEVAKVAGRYLIRDSNNPKIGPLSFTEEEWKDFVAGVTAGDFCFD